MKILALETSSEACSAALCIDGEVRERFEIAPQLHAQLILAMIADLMKEAGSSISQLDALAFGRGPGSFTGLRIAAGVTQGIAFGADLPVVAVSSLAALAQGVYRERGTAFVLSGLDARMHEVYWGAYVADQMQVMRLLGQERVCKPEDVDLPRRESWFGAGSAWSCYADALQTRLAGAVSAFDSSPLPHARDVALLGADEFRQGRVLGAESAVPVYLRDEVARKQVLSS